MFAGRVEVEALAKVVHVRRRSVRAGCIEWAVVVVACGSRVGCRCGWSRYGAVQCGAVLRTVASRQSRCGARSSILCFSLIGNYSTRRHQSYSPPILLKLDATTPQTEFSRIT